MDTYPIADRREHVKTHHGIELVDHYHWLKDSSYPNVDDEDVVEYLKSENAYFNAYMQLLNPLVETIYAEMEGRIDEEDESVPVRDGAYVYQSKFSKDNEYRVHVRWKYIDADSDSSSYLVEPTEGVEVLLDENELAKDSEYFRLGSLSISPNDSLLAYSTDTNGSERYVLVIKDLRTGKLLDDRIENSIGAVVWGEDNESFLYVTLDEQWRPNKVLIHRLGDDPNKDAVVFREQDEGFFVDLELTTSRKFALISTSDHVTSEVRFTPTADISEPFSLVSRRRENHQYSLDHRRDQFYILTNDTHKNFRLIRSEESAWSEENWQTVLAGSDDRYMTSFQAFSNRVVIGARESGLDQILILEEDENIRYIEFGEPAYRASFFESPEPNPNQLRIVFSSMVTPRTVYDYDFETSNLIVRKEQNIPSGYDSSMYVSERRMAKSHDGTLVPISICYRRDTSLDGSAPLYLYGYGAYGASMNPGFSTDIFSLLDRGFIFAIAHIRGGGELGYHWYEDGKLDRRTNTFKDFIAVAGYLIAEKFTSKGRIAISGGSAGGELMGAVSNDAADLFGAVVARVPFVDVLNTMLDTSLPLTPIEWPEWGNPIEDQEAFEYIRSYSPYDQISAQPYPPMFVTAGLNDPRVTYWEPAKYVAKLRHLKTDKNPLLLKTEMGAGHGGKSGRFQSLREDAEAYAFILDVMGMADTE